MNPVQLDNALANGYTHQMSSGAQAVANAQGITVTTNPQFMYEAQYPENGATNTTTETPSTPQYTANDVNNLYVKHLKRDAEEAGLNYWLNYLNSGGSLADLEYNILNSDEYLALQNGSDGGGDGGGETGGETVVKPVVKVVVKVVVVMRRFFLATTGLTQAVDGSGIPTILVKRHQPVLLK